MIWFYFAQQILDKVGAYLQFCHENQYHENKTHAYVRTAQFISSCIFMCVMKGQN